MCVPVQFTPVCTQEVLLAETEQDEENRHTWTAILSGQKMNTIVIMIDCHMCHKFICPLPPFPIICAHSPWHEGSSLDLYSVLLIRLPRSAKRVCAMVLLQSIMQKHIFILCARALFTKAIFIRLATK